MRRQTRIVMGFLDQILGACSLMVEPRQPTDGVRHMGDEHAIAVLRRVEQLVLLGLVGWARLRLLLVAQSDEPIGFPPALRLVAKLALSVGVRARRALPAGGFQLLYQTRRLARGDDELHPLVLVSCHRLPAV